MDGYAIAETARRSGFSASALRYYERHGLLRPGRTEAGYRSYDDADLERLSFVARAKRLGCTLPEIEELLGLLDDARCSPVQERLRDLVDVRIAEADARVTDLTAFAAELRGVAGALDRPAPDGPCDDGCGCLGDAHGTAPAALGARRDEVACTLSPTDVAPRLAAWRSLTAEAVGHDEVDGGVRLRFPRTVALTRMAALIDAEQACCRFFAFTLGVTDDEVVLVVTAPTEVRSLVDELVGAAA